MGIKMGMESGDRIAQALEAARGRKEAAERAEQEKKQWDDYRLKLLESGKLDQAGTRVDDDKLDDAQREYLLGLQQAIYESTPREAEATEAGYEVGQQLEVQFEGEDKSEQIKIALADPENDQYILTLESAAKQPRSKDISTLIAEGHAMRVKKANLDALTRNVGARKAA